MQTRSLILSVRTRGAVFIFIHEGREGAPRKNLHPLHFRLFPDIFVVFSLGEKTLHPVDAGPCGFAWRNGVLQRAIHYLRYRLVMQVGKRGVSFVGGGTFAALALISRDVSVKCCALIGPLALKQKPKLLGGSSYGERLGRIGGIIAYSLWHG